MKLTGNNVRLTEGISPCFILSDASGQYSWPWSQVLMIRLEPLKKVADEACLEVLTSSAKIVIEGRSLVYVFLLFTQQKVVQIAKGDFVAPVPGQPLLRTISIEFLKPSGRPGHFGIRHASGRKRSVRLERSRGGK
jgi:hypothetical protein